MNKRFKVIGVLVVLMVSAQTMVLAQKAAPGKEELVVWQGDAKLTLSDIDGRIARIPPDKRAGFMNDPERIEQMLRALLLAQQLAREAEAEKLDQDPVVASEIAVARDEILARRRLSLHMKGVKVPDFKLLAKERYVSSPDLYSSKETLDVRHILISSDKHGDTAAKALALKVREELRVSKGEFSEAVKKYSEDEGTKEKGGLIDGLARGDTLADFEAAAFDLKKPGDLSEPVHTKFGYHIITLEKRVAPKRIPFDKVQPQIVAELKREFLGRAQQEYLDKRRSSALDANPELVQSLRTRYLPGGPGMIAIERTQTSDAPVVSENLGEASAPKE